jgi:hypothetical protein
MFEPSSGFVAVGLCAVWLGACGGGSVNTDASMDAPTGSDASIGPDGRLTVDGPPVFDGSQAGSFITGDVDGVTVRVETEFMAGTSGLAAGQIWLNGGPASGAAWNVWVTNSVGTSACPPDWIAVYDPPGGGGTLRSDAGGACTVTVTKAAPAVGDVIEGTFTATLKTMPPSAPRTAAVTNGAFHVTRNFQ